MKSSKIIIAIFALIIVAVLGGFIALKIFCHPSDQEQPIENPETQVTLGKGVQTPINLAGTSTTSPEHLTTSTDPIIYSFAIGPAVDQIDTYVWISPSSTDFVLNYQVSYSYDGIDWYGQGHATTTGYLVSHDPATTTEKWIPGTPEFRKFPSITDVNAKYIRYTFSRGADYLNGAIYAWVMIKSSY